MYDQMVHGLMVHAPMVHGMMAHDPMVFAPMDGMCPNGALNSTISRPIVIVVERPLKVSRSFPIPEADVVSS